MPRLSVYFIRASFIHLLVGFSFGGLLLANKGIPISAQIWALLPAHIETVFIGWIVQLAMGVAYWILPRYFSGPPRGNPTWSWAAFGLLNAGVCLAVLADVSALTDFLLICRLLEWLAVGAFVLGNWRRVKPIGV
jgi:heme/copper-type cytochrome/quinol oxidase subunit 1